MTTFALILIASLQTAEKPVDSGVAPPRPLEVSQVDEQFIDESRVRSVFDNELAKPAYKRLRTRLKQFEIGDYDPNLRAPNWWTRFWNWVGSWFRSTPTTTNSGGFSFSGFGGGTILVWILFGVLLIVIVAFIIKSASVKIGDETARRRVAADLDTDAIQPTTPPGEIPSDEYMHRAMQLASEGDHRRALRQLVLGGMSWIERAGLIRFRKGLTNRDYVRAVYRRAEQRKRFAGIILNFERVYFGRRTASDEQFQKCLTAYKNAFGKMLDAETALKQEEARLASNEVQVTAADVMDSSGEGERT